MRRLPLFVVLLLLAACAPCFSEPETMNRPPEMTDTAFISFDGAALPRRNWLPSGPPRAILLALHGYNDYSAFITAAARFFQEWDIAVFSYDQRGFGAAPRPGRWGGQETMGRDLHTIIDLLGKQHPGIPLYLLGDSMGGAVILATGSRTPRLAVDGVILVAPAVWARATMPWYQRAALWLGARLLPWLRVSPKGLDITPSDNRQMLQALGRDPLVMKESRIDALHGLTNLMDAAYEAAARFDHRLLLLYGARDEIIPAGPMSDVFRRRLRTSFVAPQRLLVYDNGYHMLLRDLQAEVVWSDILAWLAVPAADLPSVRQGRAAELRTEADLVAALPHATRRNRAGH